MQGIVSQKPPQYENRYVNYFDILGFKSKVTESVDSEMKLFLLQEDYDIILEELKRRTVAYKGLKLGTAWFSDTFIIYSTDDSIQSFVVMQQLATLLIEKLIYKRIPVRGAIAFGGMILDEGRKIFFGPALIEAYEYAEDQNSINFLLTPSIYENISKFQPIPLPNYFSKEDLNLRKCETANVFCYTYCRGESNFDSPLLPVLEEMRVQAPNSAKVKYKTTIDTVRKHWKKI